MYIFAYFDFWIPVLLDQSSSNLLTI